MAQRRTPPDAGREDMNGHNRVGDDLLRGAGAIAHELREPLRRTRYMLERRLIPARKVGAIWYASKTKLRQHFEGEAAEK